ncbi:MAG: nucleotidyltransferase domain-containing protein [Oscillospiraceae bacterium]|nr:nucleotidyltransferase domain-containing protein [Oscillospiraceae bacterium]
MDKQQAISLASKFANQVLTEFSPKEIVLYGSYAKGNPNDLSDIDVAVIYDEYKDNRLESSGRLWRMAWDAEGFIEPVLLEILYDPSGFVENVRKHGIILYSA